MSKHPGGRPPIDLNKEKFTLWDQLDALIIWANEEYCAEKLGISVSTLQRKLREKGFSFDQYKNKKKEKVRINLRKKQYDVAMAGNTSMLIWLGKNELGQTDSSDISLDVKSNVIQFKNVKAKDL